MRDQLKLVGTVKKNRRKKPEKPKSKLRQKLDGLISRVGGFFAHNCQAALKWVSTLTFSARKQTARVAGIVWQWLRNAVLDAWFWSSKTSEPIRSWFATTAVKLLDSLKMHLNRFIRLFRIKLIAAGVWAKSILQSLGAGWRKLFSSVRGFLADISKKKKSNSAPTVFEEQSESDFSGNDGDTDKSNNTVYTVEEITREIIEKRKVSDNKPSEPADNPQDDTISAETDDETAEEKAAKDTFLPSTFKRAALIIGIYSAIFAAALCILLFGGKTVYVFEGGRKIAGGIVRQGFDERDAILALGVPLIDEDTVRTDSFADSTLLSIERAFEVTLAHDGQNRIELVSNLTVSELLARCGVELGPDDICSLDGEHMLVSGDTIKITRITYEDYSLIEAVAYERERRPSSLISEGSEELVRFGSDGRAKSTYRRKIEDGITVGVTLLEREFIYEPISELTIVGAPGVPASLVDGSEFTDIQIVNNVPSSYESLMENAICTAYNFPDGTFGASGLELQQGFVAVNNNVIPYGTLMYITSADGNFVYGWAVAADCGTAMLEGYVDIDCFFESYDESCLFGKKALNVYIVERLNQQQLDDYIAHEQLFSSRINTD